MAGIKDYSTTQANNTDLNGISVAEGMLPSNLNNAIRALMKNTREWFNDSQWVEYGDGDGVYTAAYASATSFTIAGVDVTPIYHEGRRIKLTAATPGTIYGTISSSTFSTNTTVNVTWDSGSLSNEAINNVYIGALSKTNNSLPTGVIATATLADGSVTTIKIDDSAVTTAKINDGAITTAKLGADSVTNAKIADDSIDSEHYVDGSIDTAHIADDQITSAKIADNAVGADALNVSGNGTSGQALLSDGDGTFSWGTSGGITETTGSAPYYGARAFANFDGTLTGTITPRSQGNIASIVRNSTGVYTVTFTEAMPDANYCIIGTCGENPVNNGTVYLNAIFIAAGGHGITPTKTASSFNFQTIFADGGSGFGYLTDYDEVSFTIIR